MKKKKSELTTLILIGAVKQIIELFSGPFLVTYFGRIAKNATVSLSIYYILFYFFVAFGSTLLAPLVNRKFKIGLFRTGIVFNIFYFLVFIFFGDRVIDHVLLVGILSGVSAACYWYPLALIKAEKVSATARVRFFAWDRVSITIVSILGPVILGSLITNASYIDTAVIVGVVSVLQLGMTLFLGKMEENTEVRYDLKAAVKSFLSDAKIRQVFLCHFLCGITVSSVALRNVSTLVLYGEGLSDLAIGYATSAASIVVILAVFWLNRLRLKRQPVSRYMIFCGLVPVLSYGLAVLTGSLELYLVFYMLSSSLPLVIHTDHTIYLYEEVGEEGGAAKHRGEYFVTLEWILTTGRCISCLILIPAALSTGTVLMDIVTWVLVLCLAVLAFVENRYSRIESRKQEIDKNE